MEELVPVSLEGVAEGGLLGALNEAIGEVSAHLLAQRGLVESREVSMRLKFTPEKSQEGFFSVEYKVDVKLPSERRGSAIAMASRKGFVGVVAPPVQGDLEEHLNVVALAGKG